MDTQHVADAVVNTGKPATERQRTIYDHHGYQHAVYRSGLIGTKNHQAKRSSSGPENTVRQILFVWQLRQVIPVFKPV